MLKKTKPLRVTGLCISGHEEFEPLFRPVHLLDIRKREINEITEL